MRVAMIAAMLSMLVVASCGGSDSDPYNTPTTPNPNYPGEQPGNNPTVNDQVLVQDNSYAPQSVSVPVGSTVTWTWISGYSAHTVTFSDGVGSSALKTEGTHQRTFASAGTFGYRCDVHGAAMSGTVTVTQ